MNVARWCVEVGHDRPDMAAVRIHDGAGTVLADHQVALDGESGRPASLEGDHGARLARIRERTPEPTDLESLGDDLFTALIGDTAWDEMRQRLGDERPAAIELALVVDSELSGMAELPWELLHLPGRDFLAALRDPYVAILRVVPDSHGEVGQVTRLPRVLFAIGTKLSDPVIRPGAEVVGILRATEAGNSIVTSVLEDAGPRRLSERVAAFAPDVVHVVAHGDVAMVQLPDDRTGEPVEVGARELWTAIQGEDGPPSVVVLSACRSGVGAAAAAAGPDERPGVGQAVVAAPLAAELVGRGVPIVVAMGGNVSDLACRLFTRALSSALLGGLPLSVAMAQGRTGAMLTDANSAAARIDWALPMVFLSQQVPTGYAPIQPEAAELLGWASDKLGLGLDPPVFYGRDAILAVHDEMLEQPGKVALLAVQSGIEDEFGRVGAYESGLGETRLMAQLVSRTLRRNHVPIHVPFTAGQAVPTSTGDFFVHVLINSLVTREALRLPSPSRSQVRDDLVALATREQRGALDDPAALRREFWQLGQPTDPDEEQWSDFVRDPPLEILRDALVADLDTLRRDAAAAHPDVFDERAVVVLFLAQVHEWGDAIDTVFDLGRSGLDGPDGRHAAIVATFSQEPATWPSLEPRVTSLQEQPRSRYRWLTQLQEEDAILGYQFLLLHPRRNARIPEARYAYVPLDPDGQGWRDMLTRKLRGLPGRLYEDGEERLYDIWLQSTGERDHSAAWFDHADDEAVLKTHLHGLST